jgi:hypothetical protein
MVFAERVLASSGSLPLRAANGQQTSEIGFAQPRGIEAREARKAA